MKNLISALALSVTMACQPVYADYVEPYLIKPCDRIYVTMSHMHEDAYLTITRYYLQSLVYGELETYLVYDLTDERLMDELNVIYCSNISGDFRLIYYLAEAEFPEEYKDKNRYEVIDIINEGEF